MHFPLHFDFKLHISIKTGRGIKTGGGYNHSSVYDVNPPHNLSKHVRASSASLCSVAVAPDYAETINEKLLHVKVTGGTFTVITITVRKCCRIATYMFFFQYQMQFRHNQYMFLKTFPCKMFLSVYMRL